ncbi:hypothetical protein PFISCL1PPCAC_17547, partial [Pristionchus fissidentatus]
VSIAEIVEVRACILSSPELLSLAAISASVLPPCTRGKAFGPGQVYLSAEGDVHITPVSHDLVEPEFHPPEWRTTTETGDASAAAVFCMGAVLRWSGGAETKDADLFSLVNVLTVAMVGTRPTSNRMGQMAKNQLKTINPSEMLREMYQEIMGDGSDLMEDDDVSYSSDSSGQPVLQQLQPGTSSMKQAVEYVSDDDVIMETSEEEEEEEEERMRALKDSNMNDKRSHEAAVIAAAALLITPPAEERREEVKQPSPIPSRTEVLDRLRHEEPPPAPKTTSLASFPPPPVSTLRISFDEEDIVHAPTDEDFSMPATRPFKDDLQQELQRLEREEEEKRRKTETPVISTHSPMSSRSSTLSPPEPGDIEMMMESKSDSPPPPKPNRMVIEERVESVAPPTSGRFKPGENSIRAPPKEEVVEMKKRSVSNPFEDEEEEE